MFWGEVDSRVSKLVKSVVPPGLYRTVERLDSNTSTVRMVPSVSKRIDESDFVIVVGTPDYLKEYQNDTPQRGYVVAAEVKAIASRLLGTERAEDGE